jgi:hypothetical protein
VPQHDYLISSVDAWHVAAASPLELMLPYNITCIRKAMMAPSPGAMCLRMSVLHTCQVNKHMLPTDKKHLVSGASTHHREQLILQLR